MKTPAPRPWTCPHCFAVEDWGTPGAVEKHMCEGIQAIVDRVLTQGGTARFDHMIHTLKNPNPKKRKKERKHGT